jgi:type I restriction enzyme S subunit
MSNKTKVSLLPKLRFPEFRGAGEWAFKKLRHVAENLDNLRVPITSSERAIGDTPYYGASGVVDYVSGFIFNEDLLCVSEDGANLVARTYPIAFPISGKTWVNNHAHVLRFESTYTQKFVEVYLNSIKLDDFITGMAQPKLNKARLDSIPIPYPDILEQQKIADCLSSLDELIAAQARKVEALKTHKKGLMQQLFPSEGEAQPRLRFPEFRDAGGWIPTALGAIASFSSGGTPSKDNSEYWGGSIPWVSASSMYELHVSQADHYVTPLAIGNGTRIAKKGALLILVRGSMLFKRVPMCVAAVDVAFNQDVKALQVNPSVNSIFLIYQLMANESRIPINETGIGAGKIELADLKEFGLFVPTSTTEQQRIADCLTDFDTLITSATQELETLKTLKKGLMQQLFPSAEAVEA